MLIIIAYPPKSSQNISKSIQNLEKLLQNRFQNRFEIPNAFQTRPEHDCFRFLAIFWSPGASQNRAKIVKIRKKRRLKIDVKKNILLNTIFIEFSSFWAPKTDPKSMIFRYFFETSILWKSMVFLRKNNDFQGFGPQKIHPKSMSIRIRKSIEKK